MSVIPNGHEHVLGWNVNRSGLAGSPFADESFVLAVGSSAEHKNFGGLPAAASELAADRIRLLVARGPGPFPVSRAGAGVAGADDVVALGCVSDDDLAFLASRAMCVAFPLLTEGFGLPVPEAMALGRPFIAPSAASMPEVCGEAATYVDPRARRMGRGDRDLEGRSEPPPDHARTGATPGHDVLVGRLGEALRRLDWVDVTSRSQPLRPRRPGSRRGWRRGRGRGR